MWIIEKEIKKGQYLYAKVRNHPNSTKNGYVLYHRIIVENNIGRLLTKDEVVHHIDGNKFNNNINNLEILSNKDHSRLHAISRTKTYLIMKCPECNIIFEKLKRKVYRKLTAIFHACSRSCATKFQHKIKKYGLNLHNQKQINENIVKEFKK